MRLFISHKTHYNFQTSPHYGLQQLRLTPKTRTGHQVEDWTIEVTGGDIETEFVDYNNNYTHLIRLHEGTNTLSLVCAGHVDVSVSDGILGPHEGFMPLWYFKRETPLTKVGPNITELLTGFVFNPADPLPDLHALSAYILKHVDYQTGETGIKTTAELAVGLGKGVCQDHAHIFISCARALNLPARYVSGYLMMDDRVNQEATHAWAEVYVKDLGWVGFDVSNQGSPNEKYVRVASGLDYAEAAPISGVTFGNTGESVKVELQVQQQ